ncbi:MAG: DUF3300 domain-containing protein [Gammaproteobacteria bacterium]|nr:MAG: DUF3300 domain-containing protein [Gammaproteobacteria bacterium]
MIIPLRWMTLWLLGIALGLAAPARAADPPQADLPMAQIEQLVAPIALYPDALLTQILMAATYPLDVVQADRWTQDHKDLTGEALDRAVRGEPWDESVKVLVQFPAVLGFMSENLDWTQDLGDAVLAQLPDLTVAIQKLRREAELAGNLKSNDKLRVEKAGDTIVIQPAAAETVYVPSYDPAKVYGQSSPPATYYPAVYSDAAASYTATQPASTVVYPATQPTTVYTAPSTDYNEGLIGFGAGALVGGLLTAAILWDDHDDHIYWGGPGYWGGRSYWSQPAYWNNQGWRSPTNINIDRNVDIDRNRIHIGDTNINRGNIGNQVTHWEHNPARRGGVAYRDQTTAARFAGRHPEAVISRDEARGRLQGGDLSRESRGQGGGRLQDMPGGKLTAPQQYPASAKPQDRTGLGDGRAQARKTPEGTRDLGPKTAERAGRATQARPKADAAKAQRRPVKADAQRPAPGGTKARLPVKSEGQVARTARPEGISRTTGQGAFKTDKPRIERAASNRGAVSRGGGGRAAAGGGRHGGAGGRGR